ncbi:MAG: hypothetical protein OXN17_02570 [Candidatus Poribacteria bacterium]|nr:hypothetical protein [Candidatus Poribacteria bacterium]MDE0506231.1 hypothetical protein [Candidatus Poribacteria bacterium]
MAEFQEDRELDEIEQDEAADEEYALEEVDDGLEFLRDSSENLNLYLGFKAYHEDRNFEEAINKFKAAVAYEKRHNGTSTTDEGGEEIPNATLVKCLYWSAESHYKIEQRDRAVKLFRTLAKDFDNHYLGAAAQRRLELLKAEAND